jgi:eukaryotic-like serine/threonine-protein kinase
MIAQAPGPGLSASTVSGTLIGVLPGREPTFGDGRYVVRRELGRGTMGVVYEAEDGLLARTVAVKTIDLAVAASQASSSEFEQRFFREARVAAGLSHPGIVVCHDVGKDAATGKLFIVFEYLKGRTLADRAAEGPMEWRGALEVVVQVARAIHHAHAHGVVHRDLKPANIMLLDPGTSGASDAGAQAAVKIMDFGVARFESLGKRITRTGQSFGSPLYMSPEQALGLPVSARSDIFSLGSVLCTLILGRPWFDAPSLPKIVNRVAHDDPPQLSSLRPGVPASLDPVVAMALAKREDNRYASAARMADDLEDVLAGRSAKHASAEDGLLAGLTTPARAPRGLPADPLASLLDDSAVPVAGSIPGAAVAAPPAQAPAGASTLVTTSSGRRWLLPASVMLVLAALAAGAFVSWRRSSVREAAVVERAPVPPVSMAPTTTAPTVPTTTPPTVPTTTVPTASTTTVPTAPTLAIPVVRPTEQAGMASPIIESPPLNASDAARSRIRLSVEHPFENGRLIAWIDGVLVYETKLHATGSRRVVAFKVREGRVEKLLDVEPGPHEVRIEVTWDQGRRASTKVVDVATGSTGLLEVRVGRMSKDLSLSWSRLARD